MIDSKLAMKILKPDTMSFLFKSFVEEGNCLLSLAGCAFFALDGDLPGRLLNEQAMWPAIEAALGKDEIFDFGMPKPRGEFLVYGSAFPPGREPVRALEVSVRLGELAKTLNVFGDRVWAGGAPTEPEPFRRMRICYENAFGGPGFPENPVGKGAAPDETGIRHLPNIQDPESLVGAPSDRPGPAGFTAWPMTRPRRMRYMGAVDGTWLEQNWPWFPEDTDPQYFNTAPEDQRIDGFFRGDEAIEIHCMHPVKSFLKSRFPGLRARFFVNRAVGDGEVFSEVPCRAETAWLFPDQERGGLLYRGVAEVNDEEYEDVLHLFARWEPLAEEPKPLEHYYRLFREELKPPAEAAAPPGAMDAVAEETPGPREAEPASFDAEAGPAKAGAATALHPELENLIEEAEKLESQTVDMLKKAGLDPDEVFKKAAAVDSVPDSAGIEDINTLINNLEKQTSDLLSKFNLDEQEALRLLEPRPEVRPVPVDEIIQQLRTAGIHNPEIETRFLEVDAHMKEAEEALAALEKGAEKKEAAAEEPPKATLKPSEEPFPPAGVPLTVDDVLAMHEKGESLAHRDLTGLDFSGRNLSGADFTGAILEKSIFTGAVLSNVRFTGAILAGADLGAADLTGADLREVTASGAICAGADLTEADLSGADFIEADFSGASLDGAVLTGAVFERALLAGIRARGVRAPKASLMGADLTGADLSGSDLEAADLSGASLSGVNLSGVTAPGLRLYGARCDKAVFRSALLRASRADGGASFEKADLTGADLSRANWEGADLSGADLTKAVLDNADFSRTSLAQATLRLASAREANFMKADLGGADLTSINLFKGVLRKANLVNATLQSSNLYGVDFYKARIGNTGLADANLKRTLLAMWLVQ